MIFSGARMTILVVLLALIVCASISYARMLSPGSSGAGRPSATPVLWTDGDTITWDNDDTMMWSD